MSSGLDADRLAVLVHELRSPVAALSAIDETISDSDIDSITRRELVRLVMLACRGIERIVADVAVASIQLEPVDASGVVRDVAAAARLRGWRVEAEPSAWQIPIIEADPSRLRQVLDNLVANAVVHGGGTDPVRIRLRVDGRLFIEVVDTGTGISSADVERIFDAGVRISPERPGSGLGLAVSRAIVEAHGGTLTVSSSEGEGTTFTIALAPAV